LTEKANGLTELNYLINCIKMKKLVYILLLLFPTLLFAQSEAKLIRHGNKDFKSKDFKAAEINYRKSLEKNNKSLKGEFNLGDALYELEDYENAAKVFQDLGKKEIAPEQLAEVFHNLGNTFLETKKYQESIEAYKNALRRNPSDLDTKYNLEYARQKLAEQQEQEKKDQENKDDKKDQDKDQDQEDQKDKDKKDQEKKDDKKKDQDKKDEEQDEKDQKKQDDPNQNEDQKNQAKQQPKQISKKDAERMLSALNNEEKKTIKKLKKDKAKAAKAVKTEKDW